VSAAPLIDRLERVNAAMTAANGDSNGQLADLQRQAVEILDERARRAKAVEGGAIDWSLLEGREPPPRTWWIQDWLSPAPTLCAGGGGIGKSLLWQTIGTALATGREFLGASVAPLRVLVWACEDDENEIWRRQLVICQHLGVSMTDLGGLSILPRLGADNTLLSPVFGNPTFTPEFQSLREQVNDLRADVLVLDNVGQVYGGNENDRHQVTMFVNGVLGMVRGRDFAPVFLGHVARSQGSEFSGSAAWENAARMRWYMGRTLPDKNQDDDEPTDTGVVYLAKRKANYTERDYRRLRFQSGLLLPETGATRRFDQAHHDDLAERIVLKAMGKLTDMGIQPTDGRSSGDYLPKQILAKGFHEGHSKQELTTAMHRLMAAGRLRRAAVGQYANRSPRFGLVVESRP
jgi:RecA-family ATPase